MPRADCTEALILAAFVAKLRDELDLNERQCFEAYSPEQPIQIPGGDYFVTVCPGAGQFDRSFQAGGAESQCVESFEVAVTVYTSVRLDQSAHYERYFYDAARGLASLKQAVLRALTGWDPQITVDGVPSECLRELVGPTRSTAPLYDPERHLGWRTVYFDVMIDWDLAPIVEGNP